MTFAVLFYRLNLYLVPYRWNRLYHVLITDYASG